MERSYSKAGTPIEDAVFRIVCELRPAWVGECPSVNPPASTVVIIERGDLQLMEVTGEGGLAGVKGVVARGVDAAFKAMLHDHFFVDPD